MKISEQNHPFYRPLWRRILIVAVCAAWFALEAAQSGSGLWTVIAAGALAYAVWFLFITYKPDDDTAQG
jgi:hypothetical protein